MRKEYPSYSKLVIGIWKPDFETVAGFLKEVSFATHSLLAARSPQGNRYMYKRFKFMACFKILNYIENLGLVNNP